MLQKIQRQVKEGSISLPTSETLEDYGLGGIDCPVCGNTGHTFRTDDKGQLYSRECECMAKRRSMKHIRQSGMADLFNRYTFEKYQGTDEKRTAIKDRAVKYANNDGGWWFIGGRSGSGKTHICTAICKKLVDRGIEVKYIVWRDFAREMKSIINEDEYGERIEKLKKVTALYIDDFFKGKVTEADVNLAFELINGRYINSKLRTILSSELTIDEICNIDEAVGGRIKEKSKGYQGTAPDENWRLK